MPQRRQYDAEGNLIPFQFDENGDVIRPNTDVQWFGGIDPTDPNWGTAGGFGTAGGSENDSQYLIGPEGPLGGGLTGAEPRTSFQGPDGRWYNRVGMPPPAGASAADLRNYTFDPQYGWGIEVNYAEQLSAASEDKLFGLVTPEQAIQGAMAAFTGAAMGGLLPGGSPILGGGATGGGSGLLNAADTAAIDAAGMGAGGNLGGAVTGGVGDVLSGGAGLSDVSEWASQYPGGLNPDGTLNWGAIDQGMTDLQGVTPGTGPDFPYDPTTGVPDPGLFPSNPPTSLPDTPPAPGDNPEDFPTDLIGGDNPEDFPTDLIGGDDTGNWWDNLLPGGGGGGGGLNDLLRGLIGGAGSYYSSRELADELGRISDRNFSIGAPFRDLNLASYQPGFDLFSQPGYGDAFNRAAEVSTRQWNPAGNPANNPGIQGNIMNDVWSDSYLPALSNYRGGLLGAGNMGLADSTQTALAAANARNQGWGGVGYGLNTALGGNNNNSMTNAGASILDYFGNMGLQRGQRRSV